jgi:hypothetical protein
MGNGVGPREHIDMKRKTVDFSSLNMRIFHFGKIAIMPPQWKAAITWRDAWSTSIPT